MVENTFNAEKLAVAYRWLIRWFGIQLVVTIVGYVASMVAGESLLGVAILLVRTFAILVTIAALVTYAYRTASALGSQVSILWALAMLVPLLNIFTLLALSSKSTNACRAAGIEVGFLGPKVKGTDLSD